MTHRPARLSTVDLIDLAVEAPDTTMNVGAVVRLEGGALRDAGGRLRLAEIRTEIARRLVEVPRLRQVVHRPGPLAGRPLWIDDPAFRIEHHVRQIDLPAPGDEAALLRLAASLLGPPLERTRPLWRMWFVTGLAAGDIAVVMALHHVVADGPASLVLLMSLLDHPIGAGAPASGPALGPVPRRVSPPGWRELVRDNVRARGRALTRPRRSARSARGVRRVLARAWRAPRTSLNAPIGARRALDVLRLDLAAVKRVAHAHGVTVNEVVLNLIGGGLRTLLAGRGESTAQTLHASVAVSLRAAGQPAEPGNRTGVIVVRLPLTEADPVARLRLVHAESAEAKRDQLPTVANAFMLLLARLGLLRAYTRHQHLTNLIESDVTGPTRRAHMLGAGVLDLVPVGNLAGNVGIAFLVLSYAGTLVMTVQVDADRFPDLPVLMDALGREWTTVAAAPVA